MVYVILVTLAVVLALGSLVIVSKCGEKDGICKYGNKDE